MFDKENFEKIVCEFAEKSEWNYIKKEEELEEGLAGKRMYEVPLIGYGAADDSLFEAFKNKEAIGEHFMEPCQWLATAKTVISVFFPFTEDVRKSTAEVDKEKPSPLWLHGRIEGQRFISKTAEYIVEVLREQGFEAMIPLADERFRSVSGKAFAGDEKWQDKLFSSNWSERHAAFACGLGTFGLSKGIITERGIAGRFLSVITNAEIEPTKRKYTELYEYCTRCGACINNCPVGAISFEKGKEHLSCSDFLNETKKYYSGKYGCGKCQVNVPCEHGIPKR